MIYFDTSYILKCYFSEHGHEEVTHVSAERLAVHSLGLPPDFDPTQEKLT